MIAFPLLSISGAIFISTAILIVAASRRQWRDETEAGVTALLRDVDVCAICDTGNNKKTVKSTIAISDVPAPIQRHLLKALHAITPNDDIRIMKTLQIKQRGTFLLNGQWITFTAEQMFSASSAKPGFVWDAKMRLPLPSIFARLGSLGINVRDAYVGGKGQMVGKLLELLTIVDMRDTPELNEGELSRWLGECVVFPTALIPDETGDGSVRLEWKKCNEDSMAATAILVDARTMTTGGNEQAKTEIEFQCDEENGLIRSIYAMRPYATGSGYETKMLPWEGHFYDYEDHQGVLVPTKMEVGWWKDDTLELYFKGHNTEFQYTFY